MSVTYNRPVTAKLIVRLDNGDEWEIRPEDLDKFGLARKLDLYVRASKMLADGLRLDPDTDLTRDPEHAGANIVRYLIECAIMYDHSPWADENGEPWGEGEGSDDVRDQLRALLLPPATGSTDAGKAPR